MWDCLRSGTMFKYFVMCFIALLLVGCDRDRPDTPGDQIYPWQIERLPDGDSRVFGIQFNHTTLKQARSVLGIRHDEGLFENPDGSLSLEIYFNEVTLGGLSGKFILTLGASRSELEALKQRAINSRRMDSGAIRYQPAPSDREQILDLPVAALAYIPYTDLDEELVRLRFGTPGDVIPVAEGKRHFLYPASGLDLLLDEEGKELLQYLAPRDFDRLRRPLITPSDF